MKKEIMDQLKNGSTILHISRNYNKSLDYQKMVIESELKKLGKSFQYLMTDTGVNPKISYIVY